MNIIKKRKVCKNREIRVEETSCCQSFNLWLFNEANHHFFFQLSRFQSLSLLFCFISSFFFSFSPPQSRILSFPPSLILFIIYIFLTVTNTVSSINLGYPFFLIIRPSFYIFLFIPLIFFIIIQTYNFPLSFVILLSHCPFVPLFPYQYHLVSFIFFFSFFFRLFSFSPKLPLPLHIIFSSIPLFLINFYPP